MTDIRKLLESIDKIDEAELTGTIANGQSFISDIGKAFGGEKGKKLVITAKLRGTNVLEYSISTENELLEKIKELEWALEEAGYQGYDL